MRISSSGRNGADFPFRLHSLQLLRHGIQPNGAVGCGYRDRPLDCVLLSSHSLLVIDCVLPRRLRRTAKLR
jgi:hypothetical protein